MKTLPVKENNGLHQKGWSFGSFSRAWNAGGNLQHDGKLISGWQLKSPDGVMRCCEGNWQQFVPFANTVLENYGCQTRIS